jgi:dTDP-4-amino-4,6-dideoxygalactose transaminase
LYAVQLKTDQLEIDRDQFIEHLAALGIGTSVHFIPLHLHPYWRERYQLLPESFPRALEVYRRSVSLPIYTRMTDSDVARVIDAVRATLLRYKR